MKDIDFDELDRAVASALSSSSSAQTSDQAFQRSSDDQPSEAAAPSPIIADTTTARDMSVSEDNAPSRNYDEPTRSISAHSVHARFMPAAESSRIELLRKVAKTDEPSEESSPTVSETNPPAEITTAELIQKRTIPHRAGRFMDVVPTSQAQPRTRTTVARTGVVIQPSSTAGALRAVSETPVPRLSGSATSGPLIGGDREPVANRSVVSNVRPPVEDSVKQIAEKLSFSSHEAVTRPSTQEDELLAASLAAPVPEYNSAALSPFLPGAKVDKRPLGGSDLPEDTPVNDSEKVTADPDKDESKYIQDIENSTIPVELQSDIAAIESQEAGPVLEVETTQPERDNNSATTLGLSASSSMTAHAGPTSISRQYKEPPRVASEDDESGAIFDPQTYQPPIEHPAKKSSGWGWVIASLIIIVLATLAAVVAWMEGILPVPL